MHSTLAEASEVTHPVPLALAGVALALVGLVMVVKPRWGSRPPKWQYKNAEQIEPSELTLILVRIFGVVWTWAGIGVVVLAFTR